MDSVLSKKFFYGESSSKQLEKVQLRLLRREKELKREYVAPVYTPGFDSPDPYRNVFHRQSDALQLTLSRSGELHVFAFESDGFAKGTGQRLFLVSSYEHFWFHYSNLPENQRHHYEVIPEDSVCHLYADLEFEVALNPDKNGEEMVKTFIELVCYWLKSVYDIECNVSQVLNLTASTAAKFSSHLVFHLPNAVFRNNIDAGRFMKFVYAQLLLELNDKLTTGETDNCQTVPRAGIPRDKLGRLLVNSRSNARHFFCDLGVYTKNRNFRLFLSSKLGKENPLVVAKDNQFPTDAVALRITPSKRRKVSADERIFLSSLVCHAEFSDEVKLLDFESDAEEISVLRKQSHPATDSGVESSPHPKVDQFVRTVVTRGGVEGGIWRWAFFSHTGKIVYDIVRNRWCENVGRAHKSNNIIIVVDLKTGIYYQKCHDPDCKAVNFRSPEHSLPRVLLDELEQSSNVWGRSDAIGVKDQEISDEDLLRVCASMEQSTVEIPQHHPEEIEFFDDGDDDDELLKAEMDIEQMISLKEGT